MSLVSIVTSPLAANADTLTIDEEPNALSTRWEQKMKLRDPRLQKTAQVMWLLAFAFWLGGLDARPAYDGHYWVMLAVSVLGIACSGYLLLRDAWKSAA
jgi:hypothetical protein